MTGERWQRIKDILEAVDGLSVADRESSLEELCAEDIELRREVCSLLAQEDRIAIFEQPAVRTAQHAAELRQVGSYRIERLLGAGGMGAVYLATRADAQYQKRVAIKILPTLSGAGLERRFRNERQILATLEHPAIARLVDGGTLPDGRPYLVMDYVEGRRIDEYVDEQKLSIEQTLRLFLKVSAAVQYAHQNLIVHRDLKPANILVTSDGEPRLLDFGIAKVLAGVIDADAENTRPFERLLTPSWASPEQVAGGPITTAIDVYSLGLLLYRLLTGTSAYAGARDFTMNSADVILRYEPRLASQVSGLSPQRAKALRGDLDTILAKALAKNASQRYRTVEEFATDIQNYLEGRPIKARPASRTHVAWKFICRNRFQASAAALLAAAIAAGVAGTVLYARKAQHEKERAVREAESLRKMSESLLFEFDASIKDLPGSTEARALIVRRALGYLDQLAAQDSPDPAVQRDLAAAYVRIGEIIAGERGAHLGGPDALTHALQGYERALAIQRRLIARNPNDTALRLELLHSLFAVSGAKQMQGRLDEALQLQQERLQVIDTAPRPASADLQYSLGTTYAVISDLFRTRGDLEQAMDYSHRALAVRQRLLDADPTSLRARRVVGLSHEFVAYVLARQQKYAEAAREHRQALDDFNALTAKSPPSTDLQRNIGLSEANLCEMLVRVGTAVKALQHCQRGIDIAETMHQSDPSNVQASEDLASAYATMGLALHLDRQDRAALNWDRRAEMQFQTALAQDPGAHEAASEYADALLDLAQVESELHDSRTCGRHLQRARDVLEQLAASAPADPTVQSRLSSARNVRLCR